MAADGVTYECDLGAAGKVVLEEGHFVLHLLLKVVHVLVTSRRE